MFAGSFADCSDNLPEADTAARIAPPLIGTSHVMCETRVGRTESHVPPVEVSHLHSAQCTSHNPQYPGPIRTHMTPGPGSNVAHTKAEIWRYISSVNCIVRLSNVLILNIYIYMNILNYIWFMLILSLGSLARIPPPWYVHHRCVESAATVGHVWGFRHCTHPRSSLRSFPGQLWVDKWRNVLCSRMGQVTLW